MARPILYAIAQVPAQYAQEFLNQAYFDNLKTFEIRLHFGVQNQNDLEPILCTASQEQEKPSILYALSDAQLCAYIQSFCEIYQIPCMDALDPIRNWLKRDHRDSAPQQALEFVRRYDDGMCSMGLHDADLCLLGISRTAKTPLAYYLSHRGYRVANVPLLPESPPPPAIFQIPPSKIFGLTSGYSHLMQMRKERLHSLGLASNAPYASKARILQEMEYAQGIMRKIGCPIIDVSLRSIEENAELIIRYLEHPMPN